MVNGAWLPVCGRDFWDNNYGASLFCQKLDSKYTYGLIVKIHIHYLHSVVGSEAEDKGIEVGTCLKDDEDLFSCSGKGKECDTVCSSLVPMHNGIPWVYCLCLGAIAEVSVTLVPVWK